MELIPRLTDPAAHGGDARDSFTVVAPSLPGYGFSAHPRTRAMNIQAMADIMFKLMNEVLGYDRFGAQGGDWGAAITSRLGEVYRQHLYGIHINMVAVGAAEGRRPAELNDAEKVFLGDLERFRRDETGYQWIQGTKPQTLAYGLNDSPAGLAAWIVEKFRTWSDCHGDVERRFTKDQLLTNVMIYWVTQTINSSTRLYYEARHHPWRSEARHPHRDADGGREFSRRADASAAELGRARVQRRAMDGDAVGRAFRRDGRAGAACRRYPRVFPRVELKRSGEARAVTGSFGGRRDSRRTAHRARHRTDCHRNHTARRHTGCKAIRKVSRRTANLRMASHS